MDRARRFLLGAALSAVALVCCASLTIAAEPKPVANKRLTGLWQGALKVGAIELRVVLKVAEDDKQPGGYKATLDSPDQGAKDIPIDKTTLEGDQVKLELNRIKASFEGKLSENGQEIAGQWKQAGALPLTLKRVEKLPDDVRPQEPKPPYPYREEEVTFDNREAKIKLAGTLTLPKTERPTPAVLLISGSGSQDRNESIMGHKPFLVLADYLTRRGIAVLRVDDRGVGGSTGNAATATTEDFVGDALAGVAFLKSRPEVDARQIGLVGHSEGGIIAPLAAVRTADIAYIVLMAGTGVTGEEILYRQGELIAKAGGGDPAQLARVRGQQERMFAVVKAEKDPTAAEKRLQEIADDEIAKLKLADAAAKETAAAQARAQIKALLSPWFRYFLVHDPRPPLELVHCPVLAINGEKDLQVDPKQNLPQIEAALKAGGNPDYRCLELAGLNHLFQTCQTGSPAEYGKLEETFAPAALKLIGDWILEHSGREAPAN